LPDLIHAAAGQLLPTHAARPGLRDLEAVSQLELRPAAGRERPVEVDAQHRAVAAGREGDAPGGLPHPSDRPHVVDRIATLESAAREPRVCRIQSGATAVRLVDVLVQL